ncbi:MAG: PAC2 family protein [Chloroflexi bacterium]|nr:PAC2 family protein [Chloroflexota bacterium]
MDDLLEFSERPRSEEVYMIAGWRQWADAGDTSSGLPEYLVEQMHARKIGEVKSDPFYLFQLPGTHGFLRPEIKLVDGHRQELTAHQNQIYFSGNERKGLLIFVGDEPHMNMTRYAEAFFNIVKEFDVRRVAVVGGVYGPVPYDKDRDITCTYSLPRLKEELAEYAVKFSNYEGPVSIGSYLADAAEKRNVEYLSFYAFVPMYDFSDLSPQLQTMTVEQDAKAWYDIMRRFNHMFKLGLDLSDLERSSHKLIESVAQQIHQVEKQAPQAEIREYLAKVNEGFTESSFMPLDEAWKRGLEDVLGDI